MNVNDIVELTYNKMQDNVSKRIYADRLLYNMTNDSYYMKKIIFSVDDYVHLKDLLKKHAHQKIILFGAGWWSALPRWNLPEFYDVEPFCFVDNFVEPGSKYLNLPVISFAELCDKYKDEYIIITVCGARMEIYNQLISNGFEKENILLLSDITDEPAFRQYFDCPYFEHDEDEVFVDAGVFDGMTAKRFADWSNGKYEHIYGFEPNLSLYENSKEKYNTLSNATLLAKGVWNKDTILGFEDNRAGSKIIEGVTAGVNTVPVTSLDIALEGQRVTFIKMDVEGSELKGLQGSENIIRAWKPKLAISVYHKRTDLWEIPEIILKYNPEYKFCMRHYYFNQSETLLYAF